MNKQRLGYLVLAAIVVLVLGFRLSSRRNGSQDAENTLLLPSLDKTVGAVSSVTLRHGAAQPSVTLHKQGTQWSVAQRSDYPADVVKLRKLLLALSTSKIVEEKTSDPANFAAIGVDDPNQPSATGTEIALGGTSQPISVIVGKASGQGNFVRRGGENVSFVVEPAVSADATPSAWIDTRVLDISSASIQSIELKPPAGTGYVLRRATADGPFALSVTPSGRQALDAASLSPSPNTLANLTAEDVGQVSSLDFTQSATALLTLNDGTVITLIGVSKGEVHWVQLKSSKDEALNAKLNGRAIALAGYRYESIFRSLDQLLVPLPPPQTKGGPAAHKAAAASSAP